ncbi:MAG: hypothetical protein EON59_06890, partial [Alphaproteobacteria bacterium]
MPFWERFHDNFIDELREPFVGDTDYRLVRWGAVLPIDLINFAIEHGGGGRYIRLFRSVSAEIVGSSTSWDEADLGGEIAGAAVGIAVGSAMALTGASAGALIASGALIVVTTHFASAMAEAAYDAIRQEYPTLLPDALAAIRGQLESGVQAAQAMLGNVEEAIAQTIDFLGTLGTDIYDFFGETFPQILDDIGAWFDENILGAFFAAQTEASPLILDLDGDGIELTALARGTAVFWDVDLDGIREGSGWVHSDDGLLVLDRNGNGSIDDHSELFGDLTTDGFTVLGALDTNGDGQISAADDTFEALRVWQDANGDGVSQADELLTLSDLGITSISLSATPSSQQIAGNRISHVSSYTLSNGSSRAIVDAWFQFSNVNTAGAAPGQPLPAAVQALPLLRGYGALDNLWVTAARDASLLSAAQALASTPLVTLLSPTFDLDARFRSMLWDWAGVDAIASNSRGRYLDARDLSFLERVIDNSFTQRGNPNPAVEAATTLTNAMEAATNAMLFRFFAQTHADSFITGIQYYNPLADEVVGTLGIDFTKLQAIVSAWGATGANLANGWATLLRIIDGAIGVEDLTAAQRTALGNAITASDPAHVLSFDGVLDVIYPGRGLGLNGTNGPDTINGGTGNDTLDGGIGNDVL